MSILKSCLPKIYFKIKLEILFCVFPFFQNMASGSSGSLCGANPPLIDENDILRSVMAESGIHGGQFNAQPSFQHSNALSSEAASGLKNEIAFLTSEVKKLVSIGTSPHVSVPSAFFNNIIENINQLGTRQLVIEKRLSYMEQKQQNPPYYYSSFPSASNCGNQQQPHQQ